MANKTENRNVKIYINEKEVENSIKAIEKEWRMLRREIDKTNSSAADYDKKVREYQRIGGILNHHKQQVTGINRAWDAVKTNIKSALYLMAGYAGVTAIFSGVGNLIQKQRDLADQQTAVMRTTKLQTAAYDELEKKIGSLNTRTARMTLLEYAEEAGRQGMTTVEEVFNFVKQTDIAIVALGKDLGENVASDLGKISNIFQVETLKVGNAIKFIADNSIATAGFQVDFLKRTAGIAATTGLAADELMSYGAAFENLGQNVEVTATATNQVMMKLYSDTEKFGRIAGMQTGELTKILMDQGTNKAFITFLSNLKSNSKGTQDLIQDLNDLGLDGVRNASALLVLANNLDLVEEQYKGVHSAIQKTDGMMDSFNQSNENFAANWDKMVKSIGSFFINNQVSQGFLNLIGRIIDTRNASEKSTAAFLEQEKAVENLKLEVKPLTNEYRMLKSVTDPSIEQQDRLRQVIQEIAAIMPSAVTLWDSYGNAIDINTTKVRENLRVQDDLLNALHEEAIKDARKLAIKSWNEQQFFMKELQNGEIYKTGIGGREITVKADEEDLAAIRNDFLRATKETYDQLILLRDQYHQKLNIGERSFVRNFERDYLNSEADTAKDGQNIKTSISNETENELTEIADIAESEREQKRKAAAEKYKAEAEQLKDFIKQKNYELGQENLSKEEKEIAAIEHSYQKQLESAKNHGAELKIIEQQMAEEIAQKRRETQSQLLNDQEDFNQKLYLLLADEETKAREKIDATFEAMYEEMVKLNLDTQQNVAALFKAWGEAADDFEKEKWAAFGKGLADGMAAAFSKVDQSAIDSAEKRKALLEEQIEAQKQAAEASFLAGQSAVENAENEEEAIHNVINAIREQVKAVFAKAVAEAVASALVGVAFPFNIILATAAGATASALFDRMVPKFEKGTPNAPSGLKLVGERGPELINDPGGYEIIPNHRIDDYLVPQDYSINRKLMQTHTKSFNAAAIASGSQMQQSNSSALQSNRKVEDLLTQIIQVLEYDRYVIMSDKAIQDLERRKLKITTEEKNRKF